MGWIKYWKDYVGFTYGRRDMGQAAERTSAQYNVPSLAL